MKFADSLFQCFNPVAVDDAAEADEGGGERGGDGGDSANSDFRVFSYNELKAATQGFKNKIGEGGFGSVYKGRLVGDNLIAVKVLSVELESLRGEREFISEIAALSGSEQNRVKFTWTLRKHVCLGIAKGLCYLHEELNPHIVHRDIKASNILLDQDYTPKLADFGLAKLFRDSMSYVSTHVAGTWGYISPEYAHSGHLTRKSDIYSFGVVLLEIMSGQPIVDYHVQQGDLFLVEKAWELYNAGKLLDLVDPAMNGEFPNEEAIRFLKLGLLCVQETTRLRPTISEAMKMMTNEINTDNVEIKRPGLVANLMEVKIREKNSSNFTSSQATSSTVSFQGR
ncbi:putative serine/threonine-protein kinase isoform X2 [Andrographis paniculata]|uniref:putative serine/threonine-protein kinase isoform X2 n=1 Tax=Andrographis paniculata TaxID=175694 RepID=UPI0021E7B69A|nr:putative serine/threonine-protein kinase isoform X2 [Andrographis paniculata]